MSALAAGLRELADWLEEHPEQADAVVLSLTVNVCVFDREGIVAAARAMGTAEKVYDVDSYFTVRRKFGSVWLDFFCNRDRVCRRVVVDTIAVPERVVPAHTEEVVEWVCDEPLLAGVAE